MGSYSNMTIDSGGLDLSFHATESWAPYVIDGARVNMVTLGDRERGPIAILLSLPAFGRPIDPETGFGEDTVHHHPSDGLRLILRGDFMVGREYYRPGEARLQAGGEFYGPEAFGPVVARGDTPCWLIVAFLDRRGGGMYVADPAGQARSDAIEAHMLPLFERLGIDRALGETDGYSTLACSLAGDVEQGRFNLSSSGGPDWERFDGFQAALSLGGDKNVGPVIITISADAGATAVPPGIIGPEIMMIVTSGSCVAGESCYRDGDIRLFGEAAALPEIVAGPSGAGLYLILGNRAELDLKPATGNPGARAWSRWIMRNLDALRYDAPIARHSA